MMPYLGNFWVLTSIGILLDGITNSFVQFKISFGVFGMKVGKQSQKVVKDLDLAVTIRVRHQYQLLEFEVNRLFFLPLLPAPIPKPPKKRPPFPMLLLVEVILRQWTCPYLGSDSPLIG